MAVQITTQGFERLDARLARMPALTERAFRTAMQASLIEIEGGYRRNLSPFRLTGRSMNSVHSTLEGTGLALVGSVGSSAKWGRAFELGRPAGIWPPLEPLIKWVQRRGLSGRGRGKSARAVGIARAVQRKIARRGIPGHPALLPAYEAALPRIRARFAGVGARLVAEIVRGG